MFHVADTFEERKERIEELLEEEAAIAVILAAADCERTIRRAIIALGCLPSKSLRELMDKKFNTLGRFPKAWRNEVESRLGISLADVVGGWESLQEAFKLRHQLIHGESGTTGVDYARERVQRILEATRRVHKFALEHGADLCKPTKVRKRIRGPKR
jgi:hypothetical protein